MFHTYTRKAEEFLTWYQAANDLYQAEYLEEGGKLEAYEPLNLDCYKSDQYLLLRDDEAGVCGSAVLSFLPSTLQGTEDQPTLTAGTPVLRNVHFFVKGDNSIYEEAQGLKFNRLMEQFHLGLFEVLWQASQACHTKVALVMNPFSGCFMQDVHEDLKFFGGFSFMQEFLKEEDAPSTLGILSLDERTYQHYLTQKETHEKTYVPS